MIDRLMKAVRPALPKDLQKTSKNLGIIRAGTIGYLGLIIISTGNAAKTMNPGQFITAMVSFNTVIGVVGFIAAVVILFGRSMQVAPRFVSAYEEMLPDHAEAIAIIYGERGFADAFAPWITTNNAFWRMARNMFGRMKILR